MYSNIDDCDEGRSSLSFIGDLLFNRVLVVYNFWEPPHFLEQGYVFQTWEFSPKFALRSWAYILLHYLSPRVGQLLASGDKVRFLFLLFVTPYELSFDSGQRFLLFVSSWQQSQFS